MTGKWLLALARHLVRPASVEAYVVPAIADLQFEAPHGRWAEARGYAGVWRALVAAVLLELSTDCRACLDSGRLGAAIGPGALALGLSAGPFVALLLWMSLGSSSSH